MRRDIIYTLILLLLIDIAIMADIPGLRQSLPFLFFTFIPGYLLVRSFDIGFIEKFVLSAALSVALLMFVGLFVNSLYPLVPEPLSLAPLLISLNILTIVLCVFSFWKEKEVKFEFKGKLSVRPLMIYPLFLPV
ncbi:MAG: DUF1616 domain-containing protein, partial [Methanobacteriaceae archaeon]|nr:DUF1616 domain-containing protein [Methanobacteriaceae archaeon]